MKKAILFLYFLLPVCWLQAQTAQKRIDSLMNYYDQSFNFNGVAFVAVNGKVLLHKGYGYQDRYRHIKSDAQGIFQIGSNTKQFTAEIILMLAKEKKLGLQDKLTKYFPGYPSGDKITIGHLLTHTSGIYNYTEDTLWRDHPTAVITRTQMLDIFRDKPLAFEPGSAFDYSNSNYMLLTYIIEEVTGKPYTVVAREKILRPLGMTHSGFDFTHLKDPHKASGYNCILADSFYAESIVDSTQALGAGALYSTAEDMYKWHRALQAHTLLEKEWQEKAYVPYKEHYGYGWFIKENLSGKKAYAHSGRINGFTSYFLRLEQEDVCIILLNNVMFSAAENNTIAADIVKCLYDTSFHVPAIRKEIALDMPAIQRYAGTYVLSLDTTVSIKLRVKDRHLLFEVSGQPEDRLFPQSETFFFTKAADAQFEFVQDGKGGYKLILHQHGQDFEATRKI